MDLLPYEKPEAEQAVLGAILIQGDLIQETKLEADHFYQKSHQAIFNAMVSVDKANKAVDMVTVVTELGTSTEEIGGVSYLSSLADSVPTTANFRVYELMILEAYRIRRARMLGSKLSGVSSEEEMPKILQDLGNLQDSNATSNRTKTDILTEIFKDMSTPHDGMSGIDTGLKDLNDMTGGWQGGDLIIIGARPSMGKTAFALKLAMRNCHHHGVSNIFSLEMGDKSLVQRMLSSISNVNLKKWKNPFHDFTPDDHKKIASAIGTYEKWQMNIHDKPGITVYEIKAAVRKAIREQPDKKHLVIIDYLQLMQPVGKFERHDLAIGHMSKELKQMAREFNIPVIVLSQLSRAVENRHDKRPMMSDIRESGSVEQDADIIGFLYRDDYYDKESESKNITEIILAKHRNGPTGTVQAAFIKEYGVFLNLDRRLHDHQS
ncbi:replicative DNA helicase [Sutcliffiella horikoshii]|uniref:replicative DNA helicase n=1 Tax=Sutcliffiella horikoshii TaxID=79883 RepID=UPI001CC078AD|nr:replicative DNA helicase [Sutcliffiella horikoshii]UAL46827.1 replicative DNA helicase [Sutcliffiella horikoshii]